MQISLSLPAVLTIIFLILKLAGTITWSWWWIFSPLLIAAGLSIGIMLLGAVGIGVTALIRRRR